MSPAILLIKTIHIRESLILKHRRILTSQKSGFSAYFRCLHVYNTITCIGSSFFSYIYIVGSQ